MSLRGYAYAAVNDSLLLGLLPDGKFLERSDSGASWPLFSLVREQIVVHGPALEEISG